MKILECSAVNFGSYKHIEFNYSDLGLILVHGATGAGKTTLYDIPLWGLFGLTSKNGTVDDVINWDNGNEPTKCILKCTENGKTYTVVRIRGKHSENDLYWEMNEGGAKHRGKDLHDTQLLLQDVLGITSEQYLMGSFYSDFSPSSGFFTARAKDRRELLENVTDLSLPVRLNDAIAISKKDIKLKLLSLDKQISESTGKLSALEEQSRRVDQLAKSEDDRHENQMKEWLLKWKTFEQDQSQKLMSLLLQSESFETDRIKKLQTEKQTKQNLESTRCKTCGHIPNVSEEDEPDFYSRIKYIEGNPNRYQRQILEEANRQNPYAIYIEQQKTWINHYKDELKFLNENHTIQKNLHESLIKLHVNTKHGYDSLDQLSELISMLRQQLLLNVVNKIQNTMNSYLSTYFDSELSVIFELESGDDINVKILRDGISCNFRQLSKGQRSLLRLTFAIATMKQVAMNNNSGFDNLFLDEPADGLDVDLKVKAFKLFESLSAEHGSVMVIDHSIDFKSLFHNKIKIELQAGESTITNE